MANRATLERSVRDILIKEDVFGHHTGARITMVHLPSKRSVTEFWRVPPGASNPMCESCEIVRGCPSVGIERRSGVINSSDQIEFVVKDRDKVGNLAYQWTVKNGKIEGGQGTASIRVLPTTFVTRPVEATLKVRGLPEGCADTFEESYAIPCHAYLATSIDVSFWSEYRSVPWTEERKRLEGLFARGLRWQPEKVAYIEKGFRSTRLHVREMRRSTASGVIYSER